jgi:orotidine-5'-phosphate decarboxylase
MNLDVTVLEDLCSAKYDEVRRRSYLALDVDDWAAASEWVETFGDAVTGYKVGLEMFHRAGIRAVEHLVKRGKRVFLDVKLHDIPNTVAGALRAICEMPIEMVNVHATGGRKMMEAARSAVNSSRHRPLLIAVTILTSLGEDDMRDVGFATGPKATVSRLAALAETCGLDGVVASAEEVSSIRDTVQDGFEIVVPGTRPQGAARHDQTRTLAPSEAMRAGASRLVIGRAVTQTQDKLTSLQAFWDDMLSGMNRSADS